MPTANPPIQTAGRRWPHLVGAIAALCLVLSGLTAQAADAADEPGQITGTVTDASGTPLANASVMLAAVDGSSGIVVQTDALGHYSSASHPIAELAPGSYTVHSYKYPAYDDEAATWYQSKYWPNSATASGNTPVTVAAGQTQSGIDFQLDVASRIRLTVKSPSGAPMPHVNVGIWVFLNGAWEEYGAGPNVTNANGVYHRMVSVGEKFKFFVDPPANVNALTEWYSNKYSEATATPVEVPADGQTRDITIQVAPGVLKTTTVSIAGVRKVGRQLRADTASWGPAPVTKTYRWYRNGHFISGQTSRYYRLRKVDGGDRISVRVTQRKANYTTTSRVSARTGIIKR